MKRHLHLIPIVASLAMAMFVSNVHAQELTVHHGFWWGGEKYTVDEETFGIYQDGHLFENLIKDNPEALSAFHSYEGWHLTGQVTLGLSLAAIVFGGVTYIPGVDKEIPEPAGVIGFAVGGGLLAVAAVFEFISWGSIGSAAETFNKGLIDDGASGFKLKSPIPSLAMTGDGAHLALTWAF
jgi:hypothetical protein